jgi:hypothetical protein
MTAQPRTRHPIAGAVLRAGAEVASVAEFPPLSMEAEEAGRTLVEIDRLISQLTELQSRVAIQADEVDVAGPTGATSTANWLAIATHQTRSTTHRLMRLAHAIDRDAYEPVRHALAAGAVNPEQALVITDAVDALPDVVSPELRTKAIAVLLEEAAHHDAKDLRRLGKRILNVIAPEIGEAHEARLLAAEEARALASARLTMTDDGHGTTYGRFQIPTLAGDILRKMLTAIAAPKHQTATHGPGQERRPGPERMGRAFVELLERIPADLIAKSGGTNASIVVTIGLDDLKNDLAVAQLDTGHRLSAGAVRRLACQAGIIPSVLGGRSEPLDLGRRQRLFGRAQRTALTLRDQGCTAEGCDWPPWLCHAHHHDPWSRGGPTDLTNARLLCPRHHARAHDPTYQIRHLPGGEVAFHRRT